MPDIEHELLEALKAVDAAAHSGDLHALKSSMDVLLGYTSQDGLDDAIHARAHWGLGMGWHGLYAIRRGPAQPGPDFSWDRPEAAHTLSHLRRACELAFALDDLPREAMTWHMLGNELDDLGRGVEAVTCLTTAMRMSPSPDTASDLGVGYERYARSIGFPPIQSLLLTQAEALLSIAPNNARVNNVRNNVQQALDSVGFRLRHPGKMRLRKMLLSPRERRYRQWCLEQSLFLNPLSDVGRFWPGARDALSIDEMPESVERRDDLVGWMNQMTQEFVSARFTVYSGLNPASHFSDRWVVLPESELDGMSYGLRIEQLKGGLRAAFSVFDKIAVFLNEYLDLGIAPGKVSFRNVWFVDGKQTQGVHPSLQERENSHLLGLYFLSRDVHDAWEVPDDVAMNDPLAKTMYLLRRHTEHRFLRVADDSSPSSSIRLDGGDASLTIPLADLQRAAPLTLRLTRAALLYLMMGVHHEIHGDERTEEPEGADAPPA